MAFPQFKELTAKTYKDQAIWFLNGFFDPKDAETVYGYYNHFIKLDNLGPTRKGVNGNELDQFWSAKFLEDMNSSMTSTERKEALRIIDTDSNGKMALIEYLCYIFKRSPEDVRKAPQGENKAALEAAMAKINEVQAALTDVQSKVESQKEAARQAGAAYAAVKAAEDAVKAAEAELQSAVDELARQEKEYKDKCTSLEAKANDPAGSTVARSKASNELAQLKGEDPLPLRKAKITQEAALRKVQKQRKLAEEATVAAAAKKAAAEQALAQLEEAYRVLERKLDEAAKELEDVKKKGGPTLGAIWWMERELFLADESLPRSKQRYPHDKPFHFVPVI